MQRQDSSATTTTPYQDELASRREIEDWPDGDLLEEFVRLLPGPSQRLELVRDEVLGRMHYRDHWRYGG